MLRLFALIAIALAVPAWSADDAPAADAPAGDAPQGDYNISPSYMGMAGIGNSYQCQNIFCADGFSCVPQQMWGNNGMGNMGNMVGGWGINRQVKCVNKQANCQELGGGINNMNMGMNMGGMNGMNGMNGNGECRSHSDCRQRYGYGINQRTHSCCLLQGNFGDFRTRCVEHPSYYPSSLHNNGFGK